ncbi:MAG: hypothetical protein F6K19_44175 [Cyanothece sp. SIO1E1]|nr:hypothetical protein [Cyanothece sp. SIO1E1]
MHWILVSFAVLIIGLASALILTTRTSTPPFLDADGNVLTDSIAEERRVKLGGVEQYVLLRGRSRTAPLLVYVHGGPGGSETPFLRIYNAELENDFLTVYWDQRGTVVTSGNYGLLHVFGDAKDEHRPESPSNC